MFLFWKQNYNEFYIANHKKIFFHKKSLLVLKSIIDPNKFRVAISNIFYASNYVHWSHTSFS